MLSVEQAVTNANYDSIERSRLPICRLINITHNYLIIMYHESSVLPYKISFISVFLKLLFRCLDAVAREGKGQGGQLTNQNAEKMLWG